MQLQKSLEASVSAESKGVGSPGLWEGWSGGWGGDPRGSGIRAEDACGAQAGGAREEGTLLNSRPGRGTLGK